ncbi:uncharacterized protein N7469_002465 [Penicillium citrinum]|uniref:PX domain-containing protein n=1 Tax=Penicillium citrinum TaxID=5077 RepID=A0A9W9PAD2_PENCI|nr:uncharacterized protein N7469_002465 [Penicillium citrinum]KAJ5240874.1 hypothetical protein N7469_002465 [Penicillium citrinum]
MESGTEEAGPVPPRSSPSPSPSRLQGDTDPHAKPPLVPLNTNPQDPEPANEPSDSPPPSNRPISGVVPPWWQRHERNISTTSQASLRNTITLEDHTADPNSETSRGLWARSVSIDDYCVVQGMGVGAYVVWNCTIQTLDGGPMVVRIRYSEFDDLRTRLVSSFPHAKSALPSLPPKSVLCM